MFVVTYIFSPNKRQPRAGFLAHSLLWAYSKSCKETWINYGIGGHIAVTALSFCVIGDSCASLTQSN